MLKKTFPWAPGVSRVIRTCRRISSAVQPGARLPLESARSFLRTRCSPLPAYTWRALAFCSTHHRSITGYGVGDSMAE